MKPLRARFVALLFATVASWVPGCTDRPATAPSIQAAASGNGGGVTVTSTDPNNALQGVTLDVRVLGSGYDRGSKAQWARSGILSPNVTTNSTQFVSPSELLANITIASVADTGLYDVLVTTSKGKKGIGSELFTVKKKPGSPPSVNPQIAFWNGGDLRVMNADGSNVTTLISIVSPNGMPSWSPSGDGSATNPYHLAFVDFGDGTCILKIIDVDTVGGTVHATNLRRLSTPNNACAPAWSPLGNEFSYGGAQEGSSPFEIGPSPLFVIASVGGTPTALYTPPAGGYVAQSTWRSDASAIAFTEKANNAVAVKVFNRTTEAVTTVVVPGMYVRALSWARTSDLLALCVERPLNKNIVRLETDTIRLVRDVDGNFVGGGSSGFVTDGCWPSWSPTDARLAVNGIKVVDLLTGSTQSLATGVGPDWRRF
jgi:hypothetical protein